MIAPLIHAAESEEEQAAVVQRVVILANSSDSESGRLASYYAEKRGIPKENIIALPMSLAETINWPEFIRSIYRPLQKELVRLHWLDATETTVTDELGRIKYPVSGHRMSYLVVCRGVPLRIEHSPDLYAEVPPITNQPQFRTNEGAVDSELSLLAVSGYPINGPLANPLYANDHPTMFQRVRIVKVSRLDGPSLSASMALVDSALEAERTGLIGRAYVDIGGPHKQGDDWFENVAKQLEQTTFDLSVDRDPATLPTTARFDAPALYFGWYAWDINGPFTQPEFHFPPGAIALHIHSFSARSLNSTHSGWTGPLIARGVAATVGNVHEPYLEFTHQPPLLVKALLRGDRWGDATYYAMRAVSWQAIAIGDPLYRPMARSFTQQWEHREELPDDRYPYVVLRELHRLEMGYETVDALKLAEDVMQKRPSAVVALKWAQLAEAAGKRDVAERGAAWIAGMSTWKPSEIPLADEAAQILARVDQPAAAVEIYGRLLQLPTLSRDFRVLLLQHGSKIAAGAHRDDLAAQWTAEAARLGQGG